MKKNFEQAGGLLKLIPFHDVEYLPVTCSHTFAACNLLGGGVKDLAAELCDVGMMIDPHKVRNHCPSRKKPNGGRDSMHCLPPRVGRSMP